MHPAARASVAAASAIASGALYALCFAPTPPAWGAALAWVALVPLFRALHGRGPGAAAGLAALWAFTATALVVRWIAPTLEGHFEWSAGLSLLFLLGLAGASAAPFFAFTFGLAFSGARDGGVRGRGLAGCLLVAAAFVAAELLRGQLGLRSPWATLGVTQVDALRLRQIADLGGVYAVSGLVAFVNAALAAALTRPGLRAAGPLVAAAALLAGALLYGEARTRSLAGDEDAPAVDVLLVQGNVSPELRWQRSQAVRVWRRYEGLTRDALREAGPRPALVVWPENALQTPVDDPTYGPPLRALARGVPLLVGAPRHEQDASGRRHFNSAHWLDGDGHVASYDKRRLLPFSESRPWGESASLGSRGDLDGGEWVAGARPGLFGFAGRGIGVLICMEALYPELGREAVAEGAKLLVNLSNDGWFVGPGAREQHFAHVRFRAVETRLPLLRATPTGLTAIVSPLGEVTDRLEPDTRGVLRARVKWATAPPTLYAGVGDAFAFGCLLVCGAPLARRGVLRATAHARAVPAEGSSPQQVA